MVLFRLIRTPDISLSTRWRPNFSRPYISSSGYQIYFRLSGDTLTSWLSMNYGTLKFYQNLFHIHSGTKFFTVPHKLRKKLVLFRRHLMKGIYIRRGSQVIYVYILIFRENRHDLQNFFKFRHRARQWNCHSLY